MCAICNNTHNELILPKKYDNDRALWYRGIKDERKWKQRGKLPPKRVDYAVFASNKVKNGPNRA